MDTPQCAVAVAKLNSFSWEIALRQRVAERYDHLLSEFNSSGMHSCIARTVCRLDRTSMHAQYTLLVENREELRDIIRERSPNCYPLP